jgi:ribonuclease P protein component
MLLKENRLAKARDFNLLLKHGRFMHGEFLDLKVLNLKQAKTHFPKKEDPAEFMRQLRVAFAVGLKVSKSAVKRNRIKRQLREAVRLLIKKERIKIGYYLLFVARPGVLDKQYQDLENEVNKLLIKTRLIER